MQLRAWYLYDDSIPMFPSGSYFLVAPRGPTGSNWFLLVPIGSYWFLLVPIGSYWFQLVPIGSNWFLLVVPSVY